MAKKPRGNRNRGSRYMGARDNPNWRENAKKDPRRLMWLCYAMALGEMPLEDMDTAGLKQIVLNKLMELNPANLDPELPDSYLSFVLPVLRSRGYGESALQKVAPILLTAAENGIDTEDAIAVKQALGLKYDDAVAGVATQGSLNMSGSVSKTRSFKANTASLAQARKQHGLFSKQAGFYFAKRAKDLFARKK